MAYNKEELYKQAIEEVKKHKLYFIEDLIGFLPCSKTTLYDYFPIDSNEMNTIKKELEDNRVATKIKLRNKWLESTSAPLQIGLMKLLGTDDEVDRLNGSRQKIDHTTKGESINVINLGGGEKPSDDE